MIHIKDIYHVDIPYRGKVFWYKDNKRVPNFPLNKADMKKLDKICNEAERRSMWEIRIFDVIVKDNECITIRMKERLDV